MRLIVFYHNAWQNGTPKNNEISFYADKRRENVTPAGAFLTIHAKNASIRRIALPRRPAPAILGTVRGRHIDQMQGGSKVMSMRVYDAQEIRRSARQVRDSQNTVQSTAQPRLEALRKALGEHMSGEAALALKRRLDQLDADTKAYAGLLGALSGKLFRFADQVEEADARARALLR